MFVGIYFSVNLHSYKREMTCMRQKSIDIEETQIKGTNRKSIATVSAIIILFVKKKYTKINLMSAFDKQYRQSHQLQFGCI